MHGLLLIETPSGAGWVDYGSKTPAVFLTEPANLEIDYLGLRYAEHGTRTVNVFRSYGFSFSHSLSDRPSVSVSSICSLLVVDQQIG